MTNSSHRPLLDLSLLSELAQEEISALGQEWGVSLDPLDHREYQLQSLTQHLSSQVQFVSEGSLDLMEGGFGFLRGKSSSFRPSSTDVYVSPSQVKRFKLRVGDQIRGQIRPPREAERYYALLRVEEINGQSPEDQRVTPTFDELTPLPANQQIDLSRYPESVSARVVDLFCPLRFGQRVMLVAPPRSGATTLLRELTESIHRVHPDVYLMSLLIDARPEELTQARDTFQGEVIGSTFDEPSARHPQVALFCLERAKRLVEVGHDVVLFVDSLSSLARAFHRSSSQDLQLGSMSVDALDQTKRFFGAGRRLDGAGSLTLIATIIKETNRATDTLIYEELLGACNAEIVLQHPQRGHSIIPLIDPLKSSARALNLSRTPDEAQRLEEVYQSLHEHTLITQYRALYHALSSHTVLIDALDQALSIYSIE